MNTSELQTAYGTNFIGLERDNDVIQVNVFKPAAGGAALFAVFPGAHTDEQALACVAEVLERGPLEPGQMEIPGALAAGAVAMPTMTMGAHRIPLDGLAPKVSFPNIST